MRKIYAYQFESDLSQEQIQERWNQLGPWQWAERHRDYWGDYLIATPFGPDHSGNIKLIWDEQAQHYTINVKFKSDHPDAQRVASAIRETLLDRLLPEVDARGLGPTSYWE